MYIIIVGCGRVGARLATRLYTMGNELLVIDINGASFSRLDIEYRGRTVQGNVLSRDILKRAEIERADAIAAVTSSDTTNAVVGHIARTLYEVPNVVVRSYDPRFLPIHEVFGFDAVSSTAWGARQIEGMLCRRSADFVLSFGRGDIEVYELRIPHRWNGRHLKDLLASDPAVPVALTRSGKAVLPSPETELKEGDRLHVSTSTAALETLRQRLNEEE